MIAKSTLLKDRVCAVCGGKFDVKLEEKNRIPIQYFFSSCALCKAWKYFDYLFEING